MFAIILINLFVSLFIGYLKEAPCVKKVAYVCGGGDGDTAAATAPEVPSASGDDFIDGIIPNLDLSVVEEVAQEVDSSVILEDISAVDGQVENAVESSSAAVVLPVAEEGQSEAAADESVESKAAPAEEQSKEKEPTTSS